MEAYTSLGRGVRSLAGDYAMMMTTEIEGEVRDMCNLSAGVREETRKETRKETREEMLLSMARRAMERLGFSAESALELAGATEEERIELAPMIA